MADSHLDICPDPGKKSEPLLSIRKWNVDDEGKPSMTTQG